MSAGDAGGAGKTPGTGEFTENLGGRVTSDPPVPVSAMVAGRVFLGVPEVVALSVVVGLWSFATGAVLGIGAAVLFSLVAVALRELMDASAHLLIMRARRTRDAHGLLLTTVAAVCPAIAGIVAARLIAPDRTVALTALTWLPFMAFVVLIERPWGKSPSHDVIEKRLQNEQPIPREYLTEDFQDGRRQLPYLTRRTLNANTDPDERQLL